MNSFPPPPWAHHTIIIIRNAGGIVTKGWSGQNPSETFTFWMQGSIMGKEDLRQQDTKFPFSICHYELLI